MKEDYYKVLGVDKRASPEDIRKAYRRMAKTYHPDVNHADAQADARFKSINEAYEVLRDPDKRALYDRLGHAGVSRGAPNTATGYADFGDLGDIFEQFFGFAGRGRGDANAPQRGGDLRTRLKLRFEEAVRGVTRPVEVSRQEVCSACHGSGAAAGSQPRRCGSCNGSGQVRRAQQTIFGSFVNVQTCPACSGRGQVVQSPCRTCAGRGQERRSRTLEVDIPAGVEDGTQIRLTGEGHCGQFGGRPGDLYVALEVEPHPTFRRVGNDLHVELRLNAADAALGAEVMVPTLDGPVQVHVPAGTQTGDTLTLEQRGVPVLRRPERGNLIVSMYVTTPEKLSREQRQLLEQLRSTLPQAEVVDRSRHRFWERLRERFG